MDSKECSKKKSQAITQQRLLFIKFGRHSPKHVVVHYNFLFVITRANGKLIGTANVAVEWLKHVVPGATVREALDGFVLDMEYKLWQCCRNCVIGWCSNE